MYIKTCVQFYFVELKIFRKIHNAREKDRRGREGERLIKYENITFNSIQIGHFTLESMSLHNNYFIYSMDHTRVYAHTTQMKSIII